MMKRMVLWAVLVMVGMCGVPCMGQGVQKSGAANGAAVGGAANGAVVGGASGAVVGGASGAVGGPSGVVTDYSLPVFAEETLTVDDETGDVSFVIIFDKHKRDVLWSWCRRWAAETFDMYNTVRQLEDRENGLLMLNYTANLYAKDGEGDVYNGTHRWKMTVQCKDDRLRVMLTRYVVVWSVSRGSMKVPLQLYSFADGQKAMGGDLFRQRFMKAVSDLTGGLTSALGRYCKEGEF